MVWALLGGLGWAGAGLAFGLGWLWGGAEAGAGIEIDDLL